MTLARKGRVPRRRVGVCAAKGRRRARIKGRDHGRDPLAEPAHQVEQQLAGGLGEGLVSLGRGPRSARLWRRIGDRIDEIIGAGGPTQSNLENQFDITV